MTCPVPRGFRTASVAAGLTGDGVEADLALVVNTGPEFTAAGVFTGEESAPVLWSRQVLTTGRLRAVVLNAGGANVGLGPAGFQTTHAVAERTAELLGCGAIEIAVCSTGPAGVPLSRERLFTGLATARGQLAGSTGGTGHGLLIGSVEARRTASGWRAWASVTVPGPTGTATIGLLATDAVAGSEELAEAVAQVAGPAFAGASPGSSVLLLASGASGRTAEADELAEELTQLWTELGVSGEVTP
jgi:glutamate N-acetyltransferase/amino-acid N-acetyltransferase